MIHIGCRPLTRPIAGLAVSLLLASTISPVAWSAQDGSQPKDQPAAQTSAALAEPAAEITVGDQGISVYAEGVQADELFTKLARQSGVGIIVDDTVGSRQGDKFTSRRITLNLANKKISEIIESICTTYGLSHSKVGNVFMISEGIPKNPSSYLMSDIESVTTEYVLASKAKSLLPEFLQAHVKLNDGKNAVILSAPTEVLSKFRQDIMCVSSSLGTPVGRRRWRPASDGRCRNASMVAAMGLRRAV